MVVFRFVGTGWNSVDVNVEDLRRLRFDSVDTGFLTRFSKRYG